MPSENSTAFLVIHGNLPHQPFDALDSFVRGFYDVYQNTDEFKSQKVATHHRLKQRQDWSGTDMNWIQSYVSLSTADGNRHIDFYEYYWDTYMVHETSTSDVIRWLVTASKGLRKLIKDYPEFLGEMMDIGEPDPKSVKKAMDSPDSDFHQSRYFRKTKLINRRSWEFAPAGYLKLLGGFLGVFSLLLPYLPGAVKLLETWASKQLPIVGSLLSLITRFVDNLVRTISGDLVRYIVVNPRSEHYQTRQSILNGAVEELHELIKDDSYDQIIIAGHSLGSVIAYDALNRVIQEISADKTADDKARKVTEGAKDKIKGLVTFGSPLDKITCFYLARIDDDKKVQRQILANLHGFRFKSEVFVKNKGKIDLANPLEKLPEIRWLNFYHTNDLISGPLNLYNLKYMDPRDNENKNGNIKIREKFSKKVAHGCYWGEHQNEKSESNKKGLKRGTNEMYRHIIQEFFLRAQINM